MEDFSKWLNSTVDNSVANAQPSLQSTTPYTKYASPDVDRFRFQDNFKPEGFNPFDEANDARWSSRETVWSALGKGFDQFGSRFSNTFVDYWKDWGRLGDALVSWDLSKMMPGESEMMKQYMEDQREQMKNYVFAKPGTEDDIFTRKTVSEFIGNAGFALGTFSGFAIELAADAVITYFSAGAGAGSIGATIGRLGSKFGLKSAAKTVAKEGVEEVAKQAAKRSAFSINDIVTGYNLGNQSTDAIRATGKVSKGIEDAAKVSKMAGTDAAREAAKEASRVMALNLDAIIKSKSFTELSANIVKGIPVVGSLFTAGEKAAVGAKAGLSAGKVIGIGLSGVRRTAQEINMASTEASFEAIQTYGETLEQMAAKYQLEHDGTPPDFAEFEKMKRLAGQASFSNYKTNLGILLATNRLQFGTLFNKINITNKWFSDVLSETGAKAFGVKSMFKGTKEVFKVYEKSKFLGTYGLIGKIAKDFGKKQAAYVLGKTLAKNTLKFQVTEGLQENIQEASAMAWRDFYLSQYDETGLTLDKAFEQGLESQWSKQGLKTFMMGAFTGMLVSGPTALMMKGVEGVSNAAINKQYKNTPSENPLKQAKEQLLRDIDTMNLVGSWLSDSKKSDMKLFNFNSQLNSAMGMTEAAAANNDYEYHNHKDNALIAGALAANRTGMIDAYTQSIRSMGEEMTDQEFEEAFGIKLQDTKYKSAREFTNTVADELKKYSDVIDGLRKKIKNLADPLMYAENSKDRAIAAIMRNTQENALHVIAINQLKGVRAGERAKQLTDELLSIPSLANSSNMILRILSDPSTFKKEMGNILADIQFMKNNLKAEGVTADKKAELSEKIALREKELELFKKWRTYYSKRVVTSTNEETIKKKVKETNEAGEEVEVEVEEKVPHSVEEVFDDRFVGKRTGVEKVKETPDSPIEEKEIFDLYDAEVKETFRQLVNSRNKQAGLNIEVREQDLVDDFKKVVDYLQLTHDERSYIRAIDSLFNQKNLQQFLERMADGDFKYRLIMFMSNLNNRINQTIAEIFQNNDTIGQEFKDLAETINNAQEEGRELSVVEALSNMRGWEAFKIFIDLTEEVIDDIRNSAAWKNLVLVSIDENLGIQQSTLVHDSAQIVEKALKEKLAELVEKYSTGDVVKIKAEEDARKEADKPKPVNPEVISDEEFSLFTDPDNPEVSTERLQSIANKINQGGTTTLSPREIKIYEVHKTEIDNLNNPEERPVETPEIKVATDVNPEARTILNSLGYSNTMIDSLSREERARILTNKIPVEDYQRKQDSHIVVEEDPEGNVSIKDGENDLVIETADSIENGVKRKAELDELKQQYDDVAKLIGEHSSQQLITAALEFLQDLWNNRNATKKPIGFKEFINQKSTKKRVEKFLKDNITTEESPAPVGLFDKPIPDGLPNTTDIPTGVVAVRLNSESLAKIEEVIKTFKLTIDNSKENRNFVSSTSKKTPQEILARLKEVSNCV